MTLFVKSQEGGLLNNEFADKDSLCVSFLCLGDPKRGELKEIWNIQLKLTVNEFDALLAAPGI